MLHKPQFTWSKDATEGLQTTTENRSGLEEVLILSIIRDRFMF